MKTLYLDLPMGAAGDMLSAALFELLNEEEKKSFLTEINEAGIPGVLVMPEPSVKCGITGTHFKVTVDGVEEGGFDKLNHHEHEHEHAHHHDHDHHEHHHHSSMHDIEHLVNDLKV